MSAILWGAWADEWELRGAVTFDGVAKTITVNAGETVVSVKDDIYSSWKRWVMIYDYSKYLPAMRTIGGDPVGGGQYAGDIYFLINGWKIIVAEGITVNGIIYSDDYPTPFTVLPGGGVINKVSNLALAYSTTGGSGGATPAEVWAYGTRTLTSGITTPPTVQQIRTEMDTNSTKLTTLVADTTLIKGYTDTLEAQVGLVKIKVDTLNNGPTATEIADQVRVELTPELNHILQIPTTGALSPTQATMLLEMYNLLGLDPTIPLVVTKTGRFAGPDITQSITTDSEQTTVQRV